MVDIDNRLGELTEDFSPVQAEYLPDGSVNFRIKSVGLSRKRRHRHGNPSKMKKRKRQHRFMSLKERREWSEYW